MGMQRPEAGSRLLMLLRGLKNLFGVGLYLLLLGLLLEGLTVILWQWVSFPISLTLEAQILLTVPCAVACILGVIWFNRTLNLIKAQLLGGQHELITHGLFTYVRHPLYATIMMTIPPLVIVWFAGLVFFVPWILTVIASTILLLSRSEVWLRLLARTMSYIEDASRPCCLTRVPAADATVSEAVTLGPSRASSYTRRKADECRTRDGARGDYACSCLSSAAGETACLRHFL